MTALRVFVVAAVLLAPASSFAAKTVMDTRMKPEQAMAWVNNNDGKLNTTKSTSTVRVYTVKGGEMVIDDIKVDSVRFRVIKN